MKQPLSVVGVVVQVRADDFTAAATWYERLLGRPPDLTPTPQPTVWQWELLPMCYLQLMAGEAAPGPARFRLGVADVASERERVQDALGLVVSPIERIEGIAAWCDFDDPFGNHLGLFQDLADHTMLV